jgi:hypothetical protein
VPKFPFIDTKGNDITLLLFYQKTSSLKYTQKTLLQLSLIKNSWEILEYPWNKRSPQTTYKIIPSPVTWTDVQQSSLNLSTLPKDILFSILYRCSFIDCVMVYLTCKSMQRYKNRETTILIYSVAFWNATENCFQSFAGISKMQEHSFLGLPAQKDFCTIKIFFPSAHY